MMDTTANQNGEEAFREWTRETLGRAVTELMEQGVIDAVLAEAKPAWAFPYQVLIGKIRDQGQGAGFFWFICGERIPTDLVHASKASSPREAARHFALSWQLSAARAEKANGAESLNGAQEAGGRNELIEQAEGLYELTMADALWNS